MFCFECMRKVLSLGCVDPHCVVLSLLRTDAATNSLPRVSATGRHRSSVSIILPSVLCIRIFLSTPVFEGAISQRLGISHIRSQSRRFRRCAIARAHSRLNTSMVSLPESSMPRPRERSGEDALRWFSQGYFFDRLHSSRDNSFCGDYL